MTAYFNRMPGKLRPKPPRARPHWNQYNEIRADNPPKSWMRLSELRKVTGASMEAVRAVLPKLQTATDDRGGTWIKRGPAAIFAVRREQDRRDKEKAKRQKSERMLARWRRLADAYIAGERIDDIAENNDCGRDAIYRAIDHFGIVRRRDR